jgi:hypothetical protein
MIAFDLLCAGDHPFEGWFRSSADFDAQRAAGHIPCPTCGNADVRKAVMAPNIGRKGNQSTIARPETPRAPTAASPVSVPAAMAGPGLPPEVQALAAALAKAQAEALPKSTWVGTDFATRARAIHDGDVPEMAIHGQATREEAEALVDDGIAIMPLLVPVVPPELKN